MKKILLLLLCCSYCGFAQINYESGYFIDNQGKRTDCLIRNIDWKNNPEKFDYILTENDKPKEIKATEVREFGIGDNNKYKKFSLKVDMSGTQSDDLSHEKNPEWKDDTTLLQTLVEGDVTLYRYEKENMVRFFISTGSHETVEQLVYKEYLPEATTIHKNNAFRQQLLTAMGTANLSTSDFEKVQYDEESLVKLFVKNNGVNDKAGFKNLSEKHTKTAFNIKIIGGVGMGTIYYDNISSNVSYTKSKPVFRVGVEAEIVFPFNRNKWSLLVSPTYQSMEIDGEANGVNVNAEYKFVEATAGVRYYFFLNNKSRLFVNVGYKLTIPSSSELKEGNYSTAIEKSSGNFAGMGYSNGRFWIETRYDFSQGLISGYSFRTAEYRAYGIILGYKFL